MFEHFSASAVTAFFQVLAIDLALAGDNAVVVAMAAAGLRKSQRMQAIGFGIAAAALMRMVFALFATELLQLVGLVLAGGILLLWVAWKMWRELRKRSRSEQRAARKKRDVKTLREAILQIVVADLSMSLDNVLAVAGAARHHLFVLLIGLTLSVGLMAFAATLIAGLLQRYRWIAYVGLAIVLWVALGMVWEGSRQVAEAVEHASL